VEAARIQKGISSVGACQVTRIVVGGDFCPVSHMESLAANAPQCVWGDSLGLLQSAALRIINLECPLTDRGHRIVKAGPHLRSSPPVVNALAYASIDVVTLANNHIMDYGPDGLRDTLEVCRSHGIETVGADLTPAARRVLYRQVAGCRLAIVNLCENEWSVAREGGPGANGMDLAEDYYSIRDAARQADVVLVIVHGGHEGYQYPSPRMVKQYRFYVDAGAGVVICHHAHRVSGYEVYRDCPIFYGLGNLLFPSAAPGPGWGGGMFLALELARRGEMSWDLIPYRQCASAATGIELLPARERAAFEEQLRELNAVISDPQELFRCWEEFLDSQRSYYLMAVTVKHRLAQPVLSKLRLVGRCIPAHFVVTMVNLLRCEAHRDACTAILERELHRRGCSASVRRYGAGVSVPAHGDGQKHGLPDAPGVPVPTRDRRA
jgi:hypothetical protein